MYRVFIVTNSNSNSIIKGVTIFQVLNTHNIKHPEISSDFQLWWTILFQNTVYTTILITYFNSFLFLRISFFDYLVATDYIF